MAASRINDTNIMATPRCNRQRVMALYVSLVVVAAVIAVINNRTVQRYNYHDGFGGGDASDGQRDDFQTMPLHYQDDESLLHKLSFSNNGDGHNISRNNQNRPSLDSRGHSDPISHEEEEGELQRRSRQDLPLLETTASIQRRRDKEKQFSPRRRLNRSRNNDVIKAIKENRSELEEILGHPIYQTKSSKGGVSSSKYDSGDEASNKWSAGDLWMADLSTNEDPWRNGGGSDDHSSWSTTPRTRDSHYQHQHPTGWNDDGWNIHPHYQPHLQNLRTDIIQLINDTERELLPKCLRLAFHDCIGGCDGCIDLTDIQNRGLEEPMELLLPLVKKYQGEFSRADVWAYCAVVATDMAVEVKENENRPPDLLPHFDMHYVGRIDCEGADEMGFGGPTVEMYSNHMTTHEMMEFFDHRFGLTAYEMVVLMGVHSAAVASRQNTGFGNLGREDGWIHDAEEYKLSNEYYTSMLSSVWEIQKVENDDPIPDRYQWQFDPDGQGPIMTTSDMSLIIDMEGFIITDASGSEGLVMCRASDEAQFNVGNIGSNPTDVPLCPMAEQTRGMVEELEQDNTQFLFAFVSVLNKMITNGYDVHPSPLVASGSKSGKVSVGGKSDKKKKRASTPTWMPSWWGAATKTGQPVTPPTIVTPAPVANPTSTPNLFQPSGVPSAKPSVKPSSHPSDVPSGMPSKLPSGFPSKNPSEFPSSLPSLVPSLSPTALPSNTPSLEPSSEPSLQPSISSKPTQEYLPSASPTTSTKPTATPSTEPTSMPSTEPTDNPSSPPSKLLTVSPTGSPTGEKRDNAPTLAPTSSAPVEFLTRRPTWSPTISLFPTKAPTTKRPTWAPTISLWPTKAPNTSRPTFPPTPLSTDAPTTASPTPAPTPLPTATPTTASPTPAPTVSPTSASPTQRPITAIPTEKPTISRPPSSSPSGSPSSSPTISSKPTEEDRTKSPTLSPTTFPPTATPSISQLPTTRRFDQPRFDQQMDFFGLESWNSQGTILFSRNTRRYIEWFYNQYDGPKEGIRGNVFSVRAIVRSTGAVTGELRKKIYFGGRAKYISYDESSTGEDNDNWEVMSSPSQQRFGEFHSASTGLQRQLDENDQEDERKLQSLEDLCLGQFIGVQYTIEMGYRLSDPDITLDEIVSEPFSTPEYRNDYLNVWLKGDDPIGVFDSVKCTGEPFVYTAEPTAAPTLISATPSETPSKIEPTLEPTVDPTTVPTKSPNAGEPTTEPTASPNADEPTTEPTASPNADEPTIEPTASPNADEPTIEPTASPNADEPTVEPTIDPTVSPNTNPTVSPTTSPTNSPVVGTEPPTGSPTLSPTFSPTFSPTSSPTLSPTISPTLSPTGSSIAPSTSSAPSQSAAPSKTSQPSISNVPSKSSEPSISSLPTKTNFPTTSSAPSKSSSPSLSSAPSKSSAPTKTSYPTVSSAPSKSSSPSLSSAPSKSSVPTKTSYPTVSSAPSKSSSPSLSSAPSKSSVPTKTSYPTVSSEPSKSSSPSLSTAPSRSSSPSLPRQPSISPTADPSSEPSADPSSEPSSVPSLGPSSKPSTVPSSKPSVRPSTKPSARPSQKPSSVPSQKPSLSLEPSIAPQTNP